MGILLSSRTCECGEFRRAFQEVRFGPGSKTYVVGNGWHEIQ